MDSYLCVWATQRAIERELAQLDLLAEAKKATADGNAVETHHAPWHVPHLLWSLASSGLSALGLVHHST